MTQFLKWTGLILFAGIVGLALAILFVAGARAQTPVAVVQGAVTRATPNAPYAYPWGDGYWRNGGPTGVYTPSQSLPYGSFYGHGLGMMGSNGGWGYGHMGGMMGGYGGRGFGNGVAPQGTPVPADEEIQVEAANFRFDPATITVTSGETIRLIVANKDGVPHNVYSPEVALDYTLLPAGVVQPVTFTAPTTPGTYLAVCTFHPGMSLEIVVK